MVLSKIILAFFFAANVAAMAVLVDPKDTTASGGTIHEHDGDVFISHTLPDGTQKVQYLSEYEETIPEGNTIDFHELTRTPPICMGPLTKPSDALEAEEGLASLCGSGLNFTGDVTFYFGSAFAFVAYSRTAYPPGTCTYTRVKQGIDYIRDFCPKDDKGLWTDNDAKYTYGIFNKGDYDPCPCCRS